MRKKMNKNQARELTGRQMQNVVGGGSMENIRPPRTKPELGYIDCIDNPLEKLFKHLRDRKIDRNL